MGKVRLTSRRVGQAVGARAFATSLLWTSLASGCGVFWGDPIELFPEHPEKSDGGLYDSEDICIETVEPIVNGETITGARVDALMRLATADYTGAISWAGDDRTPRLSLKLSGVRLSSIRSKVNPRDGIPNHASHCANHVRIDAQLDLTSADGKLNESIENVRFIAYGDDELRGEFSLEPDEFTGTYKPSLRREHCFVQSVIRVLVATDGTHGSLTDDLSASVCDADGGVTGVDAFQGGHWGARWLNY